MFADVTLQSGADTVAIVGIIAGVAGTLLGAIIGACVAIKIQKDQLSHDDETRFHEHRLVVYTNFNTASNRMFSLCWGDQPCTETEILNTAHSLEALRLVASEPVEKAALCVKDTLAEIYKNKTPQNANVLREKFGKRMELLLAEMKAEIGVAK
jgi:hypothetical protein